MYVTCTYMSVVTLRVRYVHAVVSKLIWLKRLLVQWQLDCVIMHICK